MVRKTTVVGKFWNNKNVLITGFEGFLGSNMTKRMIAYNANVVGLDIVTGRKETILTKEDYRKMKVINGSVTDMKTLRSVIRDKKIKYIFHLAAEAIVSECYKDPLKAFSSNICGTWTILEAVRQTPGVEALIVGSSDKAYGIHNDLPYVEDSALKGIHPYDVSKSCADLIAQTYFHTYKLPVVITRCGNIYGPGDFNFSRLVPDVVSSVLCDKTFFIRSDGKFVRDYIFVDDVVDGYLILAEKTVKNKLFGEAFNLSDGKPVKVLELVNDVYKIAGVRPNYKVLNTAKYEIPKQNLSNVKSGKMLGWVPSYGLKEGLKITLNWYKQNVDQYGKKVRPKTA